jgi:drug/metabolite transporter (DMT)-like permease
MNKYTGAVLGAGVFWGLTGIFTRALLARGADSPGVLIVRCGVASLFFAVTLLIRDPRLFVIKLRDLWCFIGVGICSMLFFIYCYFQAISLMSLSTAAILLYTAPSAVVLLSAAVFGEKLTVKSVLAVAMAFIGCVLVSGIGGKVSPAGFVYGLCAGLGYALYSIFARLALRRGYGSLTINFYGCLLCTLGACVVWGAGAPLKLMFDSGGNFVLCLLTGVVSCYLPYLLYAYGLTGLETGKASIMASIEPVVATLAGVFIYSEPMSLMSGCGAALVLGAVVLLNARRRTMGPA